MLSLIRHEDRITIKLSGRLEGPSAEDLRLTVCPPSALDVDVMAKERSFGCVREERPCTEQSDLQAACVVNLVSSNQH